MGCQQALEVRSPQLDSLERDEKPQGFLKTLIQQLDDIDSDFKSAVLAANLTEDYTELLQLVTRQDKIQGCLSYPKWAAPPATLGTLAIAVLNRFSSRPTFSISESSLISHVEALTSGLREEKASPKHHTVYLLHKLSSLGLSQFNQALVAHDVFELLEPCLGERSRKFRFLICKLSCALYRDSPQAKAALCRAIGMQVLVSQALLGLRRGAQLKTRLEWLLVLVKNEKGGIDEEYAKLLVEHFRVHSLRRITLPPLSSEENKVFNELFALLNKYELSRLTETDSSR